MRNAQSSRASMGTYLKQKSFIHNDKFRKSDFVLQQNKRQFAVHKTIEKDLHGGNCFAFSNVLCITNNCHIVDQQFGRFSQFVEMQNELRSELKRFYAPMLCHFYLELLKARELKAAVDFMRKHAHLVAPIDTYDAPLPTKINGCSLPTDAHEPAAAAHHLNIRFVRDFVNLAAAEDAELDYFMKLIQALCSCTKIESVECDATIAHFRASKYEIHTTAAVIDALNTFLQQRGHVLILNMLQTWFHIHIIDNEVRQWTEDSLFLPVEEDADDVNEPVSQMQMHEPKPRSKSSLKRAAEEPVEAVLKSEKSETEVKGSTEEAAKEPTDEDTKAAYDRIIRPCLQVMQESRQQLLKAQTVFPRFIKVADRWRGLASAHLDESECHLVAGFNNSVVQLWQMNQHNTRGSNRLHRPFKDAACHWELNNCSQTEEGAEDTIENEIKIHERGLFDREKQKFDESKCEGNSYNDFGGIQLRGHSLGVTDVRFSAHYPLIYSVSKDTTMRCWRAETYACGAIYRGHNYPIWCLAESPVGMYTATGSKDLTARLWCLDRTNPLITYVGHTQDVECIAFHPNGNYFATGSTDLSVRLWCVTSGKLMRVFAECKQPVTSVAFSPDGKMLAAGGEETKIRIFDLAACSQLHELKEHSASVTSLAWNSTGRQLVSVCRDGSMRLWDVKKLTTPQEGNSGTASTNSSTGASNRQTLNSNCDRLIRVFFSRNDTICCIGS